jgi:hypothetical protein
MNKVTSLRFLSDGTGFHFVFENTEESPLISSRQEGLRKLNEFFHLQQVDNDPYAEMAHSINGAQKMLNGKPKKKNAETEQKVTADPTWIYSLLGKGRNKASLGACGSIANPSETIPSVRKEPIFAKNF